MLFDIEELKCSVIEKFREPVNYLRDFKKIEGFVLNPSGQMSVFNFLFYERQWKFNELKDISLSFNPAWKGCEYALNYKLGSELFENKLDLFLPVELSSARVYSIGRQYKNAAKFETELASIYCIEFVSKSSRLGTITKNVKTKISSVAKWFRNPQFHYNNQEDDFVPNPG